MICRLRDVIDAPMQVHAGARPFVGKAISILVENLVATLRSFCQERIRTLDANGYAQLMLEVRSHWMRWLKRGGLAN
jgi:hypothetical protein